MLIISGLLHQGFWDVKKDGDDPEGGCSLKVYINVAFTKKTMFRGAHPYFIPHIASSIFTSVDFSRNSRCDILFLVYPFQVLLI